MKTKNQTQTPGPDKLRAVPSSGGGVNIRDGHGNVPVARVFETPGWEARTRMYLASEEMLVAARVAADYLDSINGDRRPNEVMALLRFAIEKAEGREEGRRTYSARAGATSSRPRG